MKCILSELLSWVSSSCKHSFFTVIGFLQQVKVYSCETYPHVWDESQKGIATFDDDYFGYYGHDNYVVLTFISQPIYYHTFIIFSLTEYVFVSLSLSLVIAKFFPAVHNRIVSRATRLEHQSLYWGTAVVSNIFVYGLLFWVERCMSTTYMNEFIPIYVPISVPITTVIIITAILFLGSLFASLRNDSRNNVPIPSGAIRGVIYISFCWSFLCCCFCCSPRCRTKTMRVLVLFSFLLQHYGFHFHYVFIVY